ncbi:phage portal protein [Escherichia coli]|nr:phage portal protein [Escherichia coli]EEX5739162.1 phage portal protein [Escherichia coli]EHH4157336.1 phage portal protein [Escherichia coli]EJO3336211.1 phage portal protein [Escherichia coli]
MIQDAFVRQRARQLYWQGYPPAEISRLMGINPNTIYAWKKRDQWDETPPVQRVTQSIDARLIQLTEKQNKTGGDFKEIDLLTRQLKKLHDGQPDVMAAGKKGRAKKLKNHFTPKQIAALREKIISRLEWHQRGWFDSLTLCREAGIRNRMILKSRQIGATWYFAQEALLMALDWFVFGNAFLELRSNMLGEPLKLRHALAKYMRRGSDLESWWYVQDGKDAFQFRPGKVCHLMNPDINQEIYGMPEYLGALLSASLSHSADMFRKLYYDNGSHAGCIIYIGAAQVNRESMDSLKETLQGARGGGAFKNVLIHAPNGGKEGVQILPFQQITAKDEFMNVKAASRDDVLAAHRVPPQLMGAMPGEKSAFGDVEKAARVYAINELMPVMEAMKHINDWLGEEVIRFNPYALLDTQPTS